MLQESHCPGRFLAVLPGSWLRRDALLRGGTLEILLLIFLSLTALARMRPYTDFGGLVTCDSLGCLAQIWSEYCVQRILTSAARFPWENRLGILPCFLCRTLPVRSLLARLKHQQRQPPLCRRRGDPVQARFFGSVFFSFMPCCLCQRPMSAVDFRFLRARPWRLSLRRRPVTPTASRHDLCLHGFHGKTGWAFYRVSCAERCLYAPSWPG